ncbi:MAG: DUF2442 domain-containing protein [Oscillibacter sp.]|nr:DUF2442 domain-containing protein [Oscillibacter sp.]
MCTKREISTRRPTRTALGIANYRTEYFRTVRLIDGGAGIAWAHGQDLAPHELYELSRDA